MGIPAVLILISGSLDSILRNILRSLHI